MVITVTVSTITVNTIRHMYDTNYSNKYTTALIMMMITALTIVIISVTR